MNVCLITNFFMNFLSAFLRLQDFRIDRIREGVLYLSCYLLPRWPVRFFAASQVQSGSAFLGPQHSTFAPAYQWRMVVLHFLDVVEKGLHEFEKSGELLAGPELCQVIVFRCPVNRYNVIVRLIIAFVDVIPGTIGRRFEQLAAHGVCLLKTGMACSRNVIPDNFHAVAVVVCHKKID
jgi:hypothetical protein